MSPDERILMLINRLLGIRNAIGYRIYSAKKLHDMRRASRVAAHEARFMKTVAGQQAAMQLREAETHLPVAGR